MLIIINYYISFATPERYEKSMFSSRLFSTNVKRQNQYGENSKTVYNQGNGGVTSNNNDSKDNIYYNGTTFIKYQSSPLNKKYACIYFLFFIF